MHKQHEIYMPNPNPNANMPDVTLFHHFRWGSCWVCGGSRWVSIVLIPTSWYWQHETLLSLCSNRMQMGSLWGLALVWTANASPQSEPICILLEHRLYISILSSPTNITVINVGPFAQVYPTTTRALGLGACSGMARIGALVTPFVAQVGTV